MGVKSTVSIASNADVRRECFAHVDDDPASDGFFRSIRAVLNQGTPTRRATGCQSQGKAIRTQKIPVTGTDPADHNGVAQHLPS